MPLFEEGETYKFVNLKTSLAVTLRGITGGVVADKFEGNQNQLWEAQTTATGFWRFKNVQSGLYLGIEKRQIATDRVEVCGVSHPFVWAPKRTDEGGPSPATFKLFIPFTNQALYLNDSGGWANAVKVQTWSDLGKNPGQKWIIDSNTTFEAPVKAGKVYIIVNYHTGTVVQLEGTRKTAGYRLNGGQDQRWEASQEEGTGFWFFKNPSSGLYMGIATEASAAGNRTRLVGVPQPFAWDIVPDRPNGGNSETYRIFLPYTALNLDLYQPNLGWTIHLWGRTDMLWQHWRFELRDTVILAPVEAGKIYTIVNCHTGTVAHLEDTKKIAGYSFNDGRNQKWEASQEEGTGHWIFKNPWSGLYMGITGVASSAGNGTRMIGVPEPFAWEIALDRTNGADGKSYRIFLPRTELNLDLAKKDPGRHIHLWSRADVRWHLWRFELKT